MSRLVLAALSFAFLLGLASLPASADLVYEQVSRRTHRDALGKERVETLKQEIRASRHGLRAQTRGSGVVTIIRLDKGVIYQIDESRGIYAEVKIVDVKKEVERHKALLRAHYRRMSDEKKRRLAALLGKVRPRVKAIRSAKETEISGVPCRKVSFYENGYLRLELWLTDRFEVGADFTPLLEATGEFSAALIAERRRHRGFAMRKKIYPLLEINPTVENEAYDVRLCPADESKFALPEGLKKVPSVIDEERNKGSESGSESGSEPGPEPGSEPGPKLGPDGPPPAPHEGRRTDAGRPSGDGDADAPLPD